MSNLYAKYSEEDERVYVYLLGDIIYEVPDHEVPEYIINKNEKTLLHWVISTYLLDLAACIKGLKADKVL